MKKLLPSRFSLLAGLIPLCLASPGLANVTPAPDRAFATNSTGQNIIAQMQFEAGNPVLSHTVVNLFNSAPVDVDGDGDLDYSEWTGTLIASNWVLTCAHALEGTDGRGQGIDIGRLSCFDPTRPNTRISVDNFILHPSWTLEGYSNGNDIALVKLAQPIAGVTVFPRLAVSNFVAPMNVVIAGYGDQGDGDSGGNGFPGLFSVGVNTLDGVGGQTLNLGSGVPWVPFPGWPVTVAFMDFDKWERIPVECMDPINGPYTNHVLAVLSDFSSMGAEHQGTKSVLPPCPGVLQPIAGIFSTNVADFLPADGDSGGPAFVWPDGPRIPAGGTYYLTNPPTLVGVVSFRNVGLATNAPPADNGAVYGNVAGYTLVQAHLGWIYSEVQELADKDTDGDGKTDEQEWQAGTDPYNSASVGSSYYGIPGTLKWLWQSNFVPAIELVVTNLNILSATSLGNGLTEVRFTASFFNSGAVEYGQPQAVLDSVPSGFALAENVLDRFLLFPQATANGLTPADNSITVQVPGPANDSTNTLLASVATFGWDIDGWERPALGPNTLTLDASFAQSHIRYDGTTYWFSNSPPSVAAVQPGWLVLQGLDLPDTVCCVVPPTFEVAAVTSNAAGETGFVPAATELDWLKWLKSATFDTRKVAGNFGVDDTSYPRDNAALNPGELPPAVVETNDDNEPTGISSASPPPNNLLNGFALDPKVTVSAAMGLGKLDTDVELRIRNFKLSMMRFELTAHPHWTLGVRVEDTVEFPRKEVDLLNVYFPPDTPPGFLNPFQVKLGPIGLLFQLHSRLYTGAEGSLSAAAEVTFSQKSEFVATYTYSEGQGNFDYTWEPEPLDLTKPQINLDVAMNAKVFAGAEVGVQAKLTGVGIKLASAEAGAYLEPYARLEVRPLDGPFWALYGGIDAGASLSADLLFWPVFDQQYPIIQTESVIYSSSAGGGARAAFTPAAIPPAAATASGANFIGTDSRWSKFWPTLSHPNAGYTDPASIAVALNESGNTVLGSGIPGQGAWLSELDRHGNSLWQKTYSLAIGGFSDVARVPGDGYVMVSGVTDATLTRVDDLGNVRWSRRFRIAGSSLTRSQIEATRDATGAARIFVSGSMSPGMVFAASFDDDGNVLWSRNYADGGDMFGIGLRPTRDGGLLIAGKCGVDLLRCNNSSSPACTDNAHNGLVMKLDTNGNVVWAAACEANVLYDVVETPDGGALAVGGTLKIFYDPFRGSSAVKFSASGSLAWQTTYAIDLVRSGLPAGEFPLGDTAFDEARCLTAIPGGYVVGGFTGGDAGRHEKSGAWLMRIQENGEPLWYTLWDGPELDNITQLVDRGDSLLALGLSGSFLPLGLGGTNAPWLSALPHSGQLRFKPETGVTTDYRHPRIDGFDGNGILNTPLGSAWKAFMPVEAPITFTVTTVNLTVSDTWEPASGLGESLHEPAGGEPELNISLAQTNVLVTWPVLGSDGFVPLAADLVTGPWATPTNLVIRAGENWLLQVPSTNAQRYFQLRK